MIFALIRHGRTRGNLEGRYIGTTDEPLCPEGIAELRQFAYPPANRLFASPMLRCWQTAAQVYPGLRAQMVPDFRECDFGVFENHNYSELSGREDYQAWVDSGGELPFPGGESRAEFAARCVRAFETVAQGLNGPGLAAFVVHGGTIMAIMERFARPKGAYFDFQAACGRGYLLQENGAYTPLP